MGLSEAALIYFFETPSSANSRKGSMPSTGMTNLLENERIFYNILHYSAIFYYVPQRSFTFLRLLPELPGIFFPVLTLSSLFFLFLVHSCHERTDSFQMAFTRIFCNILEYSTLFWFLLPSSLVCLSLLMYNLHFFAGYLETT